MEALLAIAEPCLAESAECQRRHNREKQRREIFQEKRTTRACCRNIDPVKTASVRGGRPHSITLLARNRMEDMAVSTPRALAVLRFTASSNLVGRSTGRSAGLSPCKILSA